MAKGLLIGNGINARLGIKDLYVKCIYERFIEKQSYRGKLGGEAKGETYRPLRREVQKLWSSTALTKKEIAE